MKTCLICTLGNRDIQFKKEYENKLIAILGNIFDKDGDLDSEGLYINKNNFLESSKKVYEKYDEIQNYIILPIIQPCLNENIEKIILVPTDQQDEDTVADKFKKGDTFIEAKIIKKILEKKGYLNKVEIRDAKFNASDLKRWFNHMSKIVDDNYKKFDKIMIEISGGVPTSKEAVRLVSLFKSKIDVVEVIKGKINVSNMKFFENRIIREKIKDLINNYNYTGALSFKEYLKDKNENDKVIKLMKHLKYRLNFDFGNAQKEYNENRLNHLLNEKNTIKKLEYLILELLDNMEIELKNENYANFLGRMYRLEEAVGQYFVLKWFEKTGTKLSYINVKGESSNGLIHPKDMGVNNLNNKLKNYLKYLAKGLYNNKPVNHKGVKKLYDYIEYFCNNNGKYIIKIDTPAFEKLIFHLYGVYSEEYKLFKNIQNIYKIKEENYSENLRHKTIIAHGFEGISKDSFEGMLKKRGCKCTNVKDYFSENIKEKFYNYLNEKNNNIFDEINKKIIKEL